MDTPLPKMLHFDGYHLDLMRCALLRGGEEVRLRPKSFDVLRYIAERAGRVVTKHELFQAVWPGVSVTDDSLVQCIKEIRAALCDDRRRIVQTRSRRGYLFAPEITKIGSQSGKGAGAGRPSTGHPSIAILPFEAFSDRGQFVATGVAEELAEQLHKHRSLRVRWGDLAGLTDSSANGSGIRYLVRGSVRNANNHFRISARLIDTERDAVIWTGRFEAESADLSVQSELVRLIAAQIVPELEHHFNNTPSPGCKATSCAWEAYQWGIGELFQFRAGSIARAIDHFEQAIILDPDFAPAHARLAYAQLQLGWYGNQELRREWVRRAEATARRTLELDARQALAHLALGRALGMLERPEDGLEALSAAVEANPSLPQAHFALGQAIMYRDRPVDALDHLLEAIRLGPHDPHLWTFLHVGAQALARIGALEKAEAYARRAVLQANATHWAFATLIMILGMRGKVAEAEPYRHELTARVSGYSISYADHDWGGCAAIDLKKDYLSGLRAAGVPLF